MSVIRACLFWAWCCWCFQSVHAACLNPAVLQVAMIPQNAFNVEEVAQLPLFEAIQQESGKRVEAVPAASYGAVIESLLSGNAHVAELGPASYALLSNRSPHFEPFAALSGSDRVGRYHSLLVVRKDSHFQNLDQLRGKTLALTDPSSTSGAIVPSLMLQQAKGYEPAHFFSRVLYMGGHDKAGAVVKNGRAHAAFVASSLVDVEALGLRVLWRSPPLVENPFLLDGRLCPNVQKQLRSAFLDRQERLQPWLALRNFKQMVPVTAADYAGVKALLGER